MKDGVCNKGIYFFACEVGKGMISSCSVISFPLTIKNDVQRIHTYTPVAASVI